MMKLCLAICLIDNASDMMYDHVAHLADLAALVHVFKVAAPHLPIRCYFHDLGAFAFLNSMNYVSRKTMIVPNFPHPDVLTCCSAGLILLGLQNSSADCRAEPEPILTKLRDCRRSEQFVAEADVASYNRPGYPRSILDSLLLAPQILFCDVVYTTVHDF